MQFDLRKLYNKVFTLYYQTQCLPESLIIAAKYFDQMMQYNLKYNILIIITASILLAEIMVDDQLCSYECYAQVIGINYKELQDVINQTLERSNYQMYVNAADYRRWYNEIFKE